MQNEAKIMTREQVRAFDRWAIDEIGIPGVVLMENAGRGAAEIIAEKIEKRAKVYILCGTGNNGGDGYVIARHLINRGCRVKCVLCGDREKVKADALINLKVLEKIHNDIEVLAFDGQLKANLKKTAQKNDLIVDAIFGTGLQGQLRGSYPELIETINELDLPIVAVDIPSGLDCNTGLPLGAAVKAETTVTFVAVKKGFTTPQSKAYTGEVKVVSIGIE